METERHAVCWSTRYRRDLGEYGYGKWHITDDARSTLCGRLIAVATAHGTFFPDTDDDITRVTCRQCKRRLSNQEA